MPPPQGARVSRFPVYGTASSPEPGAGAARAPAVRERRRVARGRFMAAGCVSWIRFCFGGYWTTEDTNNLAGS